jgi:rhodanese-related sulfurtransferase
MKTMQAEELKKMLTGDPVARVINVLDADSYREKHIPGTVNIPVSDSNFVDKVENLVENKTKPVVVYCASTDCNASEKAAEKLEQAGFQDVRDFAAGTRGWEASGYALAGREAAGAH